ncbi:glycosyltransferase family 2 protein [Patulibacter sp.]|uniref:glycosyltransferase family 2 protein n=1 Tax=Patulibacter sp. TaxID=1912859 RepID=UPI00271F9C14|nr:glycosyltransferase [Patulibacter sp.]MDO9407613.1 glycosyltransferase [Patulibacter sp.]
MPAPVVSVVVPTRDRAVRLARLLEALRAQTLDPTSFEVLVCDDASADPDVRRVLDAVQAEGVLTLRVLLSDAPAGPAVARNRAWREATAPLVAFVDDDCVPVRHWLEALVDAWSAADLGDRDLAVLQGPVDPDPAEYPHDFGPFATTLWVREGSPRFETANIAYPRALLERLAGFDERLVVAGEDTDLGWRAVEAGATVVWAGDAQVHHGVVQQGPWGRLAKGWRWRYVPAVFARHPGLRRELELGVFWGPPHLWLFGGLLALALQGRPGVGWSLARWWLGGPYLRRLSHYRTGPALAPYRLACDLVEVAAIGTGAVRHRVPMI